MEKYYKILEIHINATEQEVKRAYQDMIKVWHPDRFQNDIKLQKKANEKLKDINDAYQRIINHLKNPYKQQQSQQYERTQKQERQERQASQPPPSTDDVRFCPNCGTKNKILRGMPNNIATCWKCNQPLYHKKQAKQPPPRQKKPLKKHEVFYMVLGFILLAVILNYIKPRLVDNANTSTKPDSTNQKSLNDLTNDKELNNPIPPQPPRDLFEEAGITITPPEEQLKTDRKQPTISNQILQPLPIPVNGAVEMYVTDEAIAPLKILTRESGNHYFVKIVDWYTNKLICTVFICLGQSVSLDLPLGSYKLKYATGSQWYGVKFLFGKETVYSVADKKLDFEKHGDKVSGYTVELFLQPNGNLRTKRIAAEEF